MFGANPFACIWFAEPSFQPVSVEDEGQRGGHFLPKGKRRKRKRRDLDDFYGPWPGMLWPGNTDKPQEQPTVEVEPQLTPEPVAAAVAVSSEILGKLSRQLAKRQAVPMTPAIQREIARIKGQIRQELEEEQILMMLGLFD